MTEKHILNTKKRIIRLLQKNGEMRYTELKTKIGITDTAISKNLASLCDEGSIEYQKRGREKYYRIGISISKIFKRKMEILSHNYLDYVIDEFSLNDSNCEHYKIIEEKIGVFFIFTIITSIQTGKNWFKAFDSDVILDRLMGNIGYQIFKDKPLPDKWFENLETMSHDEYFENAKNMTKSSELQNNITNMYETLRKKYSKEITKLEKLAKH